MVFINHYKDPAEVWSRFNTREEAEKYMKQMGGVYTVKEGESFNKDWIKEESDSRKNNI